MFPIPDKIVEVAEFTAQNVYSTRQTNIKPFFYDLVYNRTTDLKERVLVFTADLHSRHTCRIKYQKQYESCSWCRLACSQLHLPALQYKKISWTKLKNVPELDQDVGFEVSRNCLFTFLSRNRIMVSDVVDSMAALALSRSWMTLASNPSSIDSGCISVNYCAIQP